MKKRFTYHPGKDGLYDFENEHDACGVGFVANVDGRKEHKIIQQGIRVLEKLMHRGAVGGEPRLLGRHERGLSPDRGALFARSQRGRPAPS